MLAEQLITIANKTPKACEIISKSKKLLSGSVLFASDVNKIEHTIPCQLTSDTLTDFSSVQVSRYGKNLLKFEQGSLSTGTFIEKLDNGAVMKGNYSEGSNNNGYPNGWYNLTKAEINLKTGDVVTISCDYTVLELDEHRTIDEFTKGNSTKKVGLYLCSDDSNHYVPSQIQPKVLGETVRMYNTFTITVDSAYHPLITLNSNKVQVKNIQIEVGSKSTGYEEYRGKQTITANADGTVDGITSVAPNMTILTDSDVNIKCQYYPQGAPLEVFKEISSALLSAKEEVIK